MRKLFKTSLTAVICFVFGVTSAASLNYVFAATDTAPKEPPPNAKVVPTFDGVVIKDVKLPIGADINIEDEKIKIHRTPVGTTAAFSSSEVIDNDNYSNAYGHQGFYSFLNLKTTNRPLIPDAPYMGKFAFSNINLHTQAENNSKYLVGDQGTSISSQISNLMKSSDGAITLQADMNDFYLSDEGKESFRGLGAYTTGTYSNIWNTDWRSKSTDNKIDKFKISASGYLSLSGNVSAIDKFSHGIGVYGSGLDYGVLGTTYTDGSIGVAGIIGYNEYSKKVESGAGIMGAIINNKKEYLKTAYLGAIRQDSSSNSSIHYGIYTDDNAYIKELKSLDIQSSANTDLSVFGLNNLNLKSGNDVIIAAGKNNILKGAKTVIDSKSGLQIIQGDVEINNVSNISANAKKIALNASESGITINSDKGPISIKSSDDKTILEIVNGQIHIKDIYVYDRLYCVKGATSCLPKDTDPIVNEEKPRKFLLWIKEKLSAPAKIARSSDPKVINGERSVLSNLENISITFQKPAKVGIYDYTEFKLRGANPCTGNGLDRFNADRVFDVLKKKDDKTCEARNRGNFQFQAHGESTRAGARAIYGNVFELKDGTRTPIRDVSVDCIDKYGNSTNGKSDVVGFFRNTLGDNYTGILTCTIKKPSDLKFEPSDPIEINIDNVDDVVHMDYYVNPKEIYY
ncbi:hypothetical protein A2483_03500 [Candidatus Peregrinibacteria bacterium RIFOXYC2_FULL_33_13]|nr:MAG: hypothetical protein UR27_C0010G0050 [Candidatus Peregrinibacteria bacterium GW2011_GWA2_33_10]KKP41238.1 MAG: hypothetical protein UR30_C0001G0085 [Candidatus Peregrinibacteria bacterium GW2011_GWC2_33_13]OGJ49149.1 MAG: hypothetical protein A2229_01665 [Candidatus Peregrinibacteria bacterium RIFOXYA2_FULL_33_7]OGJ54381.1 MAG: hypothetical protein A2483_03500 [Candidatus Peregrinibacteria bacterium RIFOXYC2_FULL_33_13]